MARFSGHIIGYEIVFDWEVFQEKAILDGGDGMLTIDKANDDR